LDNYHAVWREAVVENYKGLKVITMPPPSSGGIALMQLLKYVENYPLKKWGWHSDSTTQVMIEAERRVFADRAKWLGDPDFVKVPQKELLSQEFLKQRWQDFNFDLATDSKKVSEELFRVMKVWKPLTPHLQTKRKCCFYYNNSQ
jgi:gamma-glutamyltranspeptidase/glutathione hydrolase